MGELLRGDLFLGPPIFVDPPTYVGGKMLIDRRFVDICFYYILGTSSDIQGLVLFEIFAGRYKQNLARFGRFFFGSTVASMITVVFLRVCLVYHAFIPNRRICSEWF